MQVKLLRAIQEKTIRPIGHAKELSVNVRLLSATHKDSAATEVSEIMLQQTQVATVIPYINGL